MHDDNDLKLYIMVYPKPSKVILSAKKVNSSGIVDHGK